MDNANWIATIDDEDRRRIVESSTFEQHPRGQQMVGQRRTRVFVSFDFDNDRDIKNAWVGQTRYPNSPFEIADWSLKEEQEERNWETKAKERIRRAEVVVVMCGRHTHRATGVASELRMAQQLGKPYFLLRCYPKGTCTAPSTSRPTDKIYRWTWENVRILLNGGR